MKHYAIPMLLVLGAGPVLAVPAPLSEEPPADGLLFGPVIKMGGPDEHILFLAAEDGVELSTVKGAPYQAEFVTEVSQTLADGKRISRKHTGAVYRDGEGRVRREQVFGGIGATMAPEKTPKLVFIHDPVAGVGWVLDPEEKVARKLPEAGRFRGEWEQRHSEEHPKGARTERPAGRHESLGTQVVEGVEATGKRVVHTIPAGSIGNEQPIEIVHESWYSPELQGVVMSRRSDPRFGETVYRLTNIQRGEPEHALFEVPEGYRVEDKPGPQMLRKPSGIRR